MNIAIVTDSTADIPRELVDKENITVVQAILVIDGISQEDGTGITREEFYDKLPTMNTPPTTATPSIGTFLKVYEKLIQDGYQKILSIHVSSRLSGICATAQMAAKSFGDKVSVIDSGQLSLGLGFQVLKAAEAAKHNDSHSEVISQVIDFKDRVRVIAMLDTLEYVHRSGRVSWAKARIGSLLKIKPFLEIKDGQVLNLGQTRSRKRGLDQLTTLLIKMGPISKLGILHTNAICDAEEFLEKVKMFLSHPPIIVNVTTIVGTHVGPNGLGFAAVLEC